MAEILFLSALLISSMKIQLSATWEEQQQPPWLHEGFYEGFMEASWRLLFHEAAAQGKNRNKTRGNNTQHIELLSCMTDRHTKNMCAGILTWGWSRRTCKNFAQGLVQEGGEKIANWVWSASFMLVSSCHKTNLMTNLDADHLHITCVELYVIVHVPNGLPLGFVRTTALAPPPPCMHCQTPHLFKTTTRSSLTNEKQQIEEEKGTADWRWRRTRRGSNRWSKQAWALIFRV